MKKIIYIFAALILLCLVSWRSILDIYYFSAGQQKMQQEQFLEASEFFMKLSDKSISLHNLGNVFFEHGYRQSWQEKIQYYRQSVIFYELSLEEREDEGTRKNYEYVMSLLQEQEQESQNQESDSDQNQPESPEESSSQWSDESQPEIPSPEESSQPQESASQQDTWEQQPSQEQNTQNMQVPERGEQYQLQESDSAQDLSSQELKALEQYIDDLENTQQRNQQFFGKQSPTTSWDVFDQLFRNPFFEQNLDSTEKDW